MKKSHTCEEGRTHVRIFVYYLFMNLKNNNLLKELLKCAKKECKYYNIYKNKKKKNKNKIKKNTWRYHHFIPAYQQSS